MFYKRKQKGQALIYGLFVLIGGLAALFFLFNTGQLSREKTKLVNTADAVAYSAGVMHARVLNFQAYTNRAMIANTVVIAQLVSVSSWIQYTRNLGMYGMPTAGNAFKYPTFYPSYLMAETLGSYLQEALVDTEQLAVLSRTSDGIAHALSWAQVLAHGALLNARQRVMEDVANANYRDDGAVSVDLVQPIPDPYMQFVNFYEGKDRGRFAEVARTAANQDAFLPKRSWSLVGLYSDCAGVLKRDWLDRRGGTELVNFDQWAALDTLSEKRWRKRNKLDVFCTAIDEAQAGWGRQVAAHDEKLDLNPTHYDSSLLVNPGSTGLAIAMSSSAWDYKGLPSFHDLSADALKQADPRLRFAIRLRRHKSQTTTSEARSEIASAPRLNAYQANLAGDDNELVAVSTSEVFFERDGEAKDNIYGKKIGRPSEIGNLFNPYWQVHLIQSDAEVKKAQLLQKVVLP